jgi:hypothetical protein
MRIPEHQSVGAEGRAVEPAHPARGPSLEVLTWVA